jgi:hypothetical protein
VSLSEIILLENVFVVDVEDLRDDGDGDDDDGLTNADAIDVTVVINVVLVVVIIVAKFTVSSA